MDGRLLTAAEVAELLGVLLGTLYQWWTKQYGPPAARIGKYVRYRAGDVEAWVDSRYDDPLPAA